jgi:hypothetical protein
MDQSSALQPVGGPAGLLQCDTERLLCVGGRGLCQVAHLGVGVRLEVCADGLQRGLQPRDSLLIQRAHGGRQLRGHQQERQRRQRSGALCAQPEGARKLPVLLRCPTHNTPQLSQKLALILLLVGQHLHYMCEQQPSHTLASPSALGTPCCAILNVRDTPPSEQPRNKLLVPRMQPLK